MLRWTLGYTCLFPFWFPQCVCPAVGLLDHKAVLFSVLRGNSLYSCISDMQRVLIIYSCRRLAYPERCLRLLWRTHISVHLWAHISHFCFSVQNNAVLTCLLCLNCFHCHVNISWFGISPLAIMSSLRNLSMLQVHIIFSCDELINYWILVSQR